MPKFRKRPVVIEAIQFDGSLLSASDVLGFINGNDATGPAVVSYDPDKGYATVYIQTLEGVMEAKPGWWIIRGVEGEFYPCEPAIFEKTYEPVEE